MKRILPLVLIMFMVMPSNSSYCKSQNIKLSQLKSKYICVMDFESGRVLFEKNSKIVVPMASTTKIMTAIIALENSSIHDIVTVSKRASSIHGSTIGLKYGQKATMEELLYGLMLRSGNDCAIAIAEHTGGSVEEFAALMDSKTFDIGAFDTHFSTPHGLDADGHFTTAYDLALITRYAMSNDVFQKIVSTKNITIDSVDGQRSFHNINKILSMLEGADGVKTGYTGKAGKCLVSSALQNNRRVICIVLDSHNRWRDSKSLLEYGLKNFNNSLQIKCEEYYSYLDVTNGNKRKVKIGIDKTIGIPLSDLEIENVTVKAILPNKLSAPLFTGQEVGRLVINYEGKEIYTIPYKTLENVETSKTKSIIDRILINIENPERGND